MSFKHINKKQMEQLATLKIEFGINAQKILQNLTTNNKELEVAVEKGLQRAVDEVLTGNDFEQMIVDSFKSELNAVIKSAASDWSLRHKLHDAIGKAIETKIDGIAKEWADKALKSF